MSLEEKVWRVMSLGKISHDEAMRIQESVYAQRKQMKTADTTIFLEYPPIITKGNTELWNKIHASPEELAEKNIQVYQEDRGGGTAYLGPGQLIMYNILSLKGLGLSPYTYQRKMEEVAAMLAGNLGFQVQYQAETLEVDTGEGKKGKKYLSVWYSHQGKNCKFFSQGHRIPDYDITKFGAVFYVSTESLRHMQLVNQCGFNSGQVGICSIEQILGHSVSHEEIKEILVKAMQKIFGYKKAEQEVPADATA